MSEKYVANGNIFYIRVNKGVLMEDVNLIIATESEIKDAQILMIIPILARARVDTWTSVKSSLTEVLS